MENNTTWSMWFADNTRTIHFASPEFVAWATQRAVIVYDLMTLTGYAVAFSDNSKNFEGETRPLIVNGNEVYAPDHTPWTWMTAEEKQVMIDLLRKVISYRQSPLPPEYDRIWKDATEQVRTLVISKPGQVKRK